MRRSRPRLTLRFGIKGLIIAQAIMLLITATLQYRSARLLFGPVFADPRRLDGRIVRRMFRFGGWTQATALLNVVIVDAGRFLAASLVSVASVSFYEVGSKLAYISRSLPNYLVDAVSPAAAAADAHEDRTELHRLEITSSLYLLVATTLLAGFVIGACEPIMRVWLGTTYPFVTAITLWLGIGYVMSSSATIGVTMLRSVGRPDLEAACVGVGAFVNVVATFVLIRAYGIVGAAAGTCAGWVAFAVFYAAFQRLRPQPAFGQVTFGSALRIVCVGAACTCALAWFVRCGAIRDLFASRVPGIGGLCLSGVLYVSLFAAMGWSLGAFRFDQERIERNVGRLRRLSSARFGRAQA